MESSATVQELFKSWRNEGNAEAGMEMAQKFSDWYYAITAARLGDQLGRQPLELACKKFEEGITQVTRTSELVDWAWGLVEQSTRAVGTRVNGGDFPNALTGNRSPTALLQTVAPRLDPKHLKLLTATYDANVSIDSLSQLAEDNGGMPLSILVARYELKRLLASLCQVPFQVLPASPNLDLAPLPLYEAARMSSHEEDASFEKWLLSDLELCKDVAEFSVFAHALRVGAFSKVTPAAERPPRPATTPPLSTPTEAPAATKASQPPAPSPAEPTLELPPPKAESGGMRNVVIFGALFIIAFLVMIVIGLVLTR